jgi:hypothetical protein
MYVHVLIAIVGLINTISAIRNGAAFLIDFNCCWRVDHGEGHGTALSMIGSNVSKLQSNSARGPCVPFLPLKIFHH